MIHSSKLSRNSFSWWKVQGDTINVNQCWKSGARLTRLCRTPGHLQDFLRPSFAVPGKTQDACRIFISWSLIWKIRVLNANSQCYHQVLTFNKEVFFLLIQNCLFTELIKCVPFRSNLLLGGDKCPWKAMFAQQRPSLGRQGFFCLF